MAGYEEARGYRNIGIDGHVYRAHVLAWFYVKKRWPRQIDHRNGVRTDNRFANLRLATTAQNQHNSRRQVNNTSGFKGVSYVKARYKWQAQIRVNGISLGLGHFDTPEQAYAAYCAAAMRLHGEFARLS